MTRGWILPEPSIVLGKMWACEPVLDRDTYGGKSDGKFFLENSNSRWIKLKVRLGIIYLVPCNKSIHKIFVCL